MTFFISDSCPVFQIVMKLQAALINIPILTMDEITMCNAEEDAHNDELTQNLNS